MKWMKRTWLSIIRRPGKSLLLMLVVFVMGNLLAGSLAIITTSKAVKSELRKSVGPQATIAPKDEYYENYQNIDILNQFIDVTQSLCEDERVLEGEVHIEKNAYYDLKKEQGFPEGTLMWINLYGTNVIESKYFKSGSQSLTYINDNRLFTQEEIESDEPVAVMSYDLATEYSENTMHREKTGLYIGKEIPLYFAYNWWDGDGEHVFKYEFNVKIVGIFSSKSNEVYDRNMMYIPNKALMKIAKEADEAAKKEMGENYDQIYYGKLPTIDFATYTLSDLDTLESFDIDAKKAIEALPGEFGYESTARTYKRNAGPIENLDMIAEIIFITAIIATVVILGLVIIFFISDRKKEMGIYSSLGEKKKNVIAQIVCEVFLVSVIAISLSSISGIFVGNKLSNYMLEVQRYVQREQDLGYISKLPVIYKPLSSPVEMKTRDDVIDLYTTKPSVEYFTVLYVVGTCTVIVSCILPMMYLVRLKPKEIMM